MIFSIELPVPQNSKRQIKHHNVIFIEKSKLCCVVLPDKTTKEYIYPAEMVIDGDVINRDDLRLAVTSWLSESGIKIAETTFIVDRSIIFDVPISPDPRTKTINSGMIDSFIDSIPFQRVTMIKKPLKNGDVRIIATDKDLINVLEHVFEKEGYEIAGIYPDLSLVIEGVNNTPYEDIVERAKRHYVAYSSKEMQQYAFDLIAHQKKPLTQMSVGEAAQQPVQPWVAMLLVILLIGIAVGISYWQYYQTRQNQIQIVRKRAEQLAKKADSNKKNPSDKISVSAGLEPQIASSSASESAKVEKGATSSASIFLPVSPTSLPTSTQKVRIQILYTSQTVGLYERVRDSLLTNSKYEITGQVETRELGPNRIFSTPQTTPETSSEVFDLLRAKGVQAEQKQATIEGFDMVVELGSYTPVAPTATKPSSSP